jgi:serine protease Do
VNKHRFIFAGLLGFILATTSVQLVLGYTAEDISRIAKEVTVIIDAKNTKASGVVIGRQGSEYSVLTNWHVLKSADEYTVKTKDGEIHRIQQNSIKHIDGFDLAIATFLSAKSYRVAELGNSDTIAEGSTLYVTGAPANLQGITSRNLLVVSGQLVGYDPPAENGYTLIYSNNTMPGMSGGSVIDSNGNLIGIHGRGSRDQNDQKSGFNLGIPINLFVANASRLGIKYTLTQPRIGEQNRYSLPPVLRRGRPQIIDGSDNTHGACPGEKC